MQATLISDLNKDLSVNVNEQCRGPTLAEAIFFFPVFRVQSHTVNV